MIKTASALYGRVLIVKTPAGYEMGGKIYKTLTAATTAADKRKK